MGSDSQSRMDVESRVRVDSEAIASSAMNRHCAYTARAICSLTFIANYFFTLFLKTNNYADNK